MFQYEIHLLKSGKIIYLHKFVYGKKQLDKTVLIRKEIDIFEFRNILSVFMIYHKSGRTNVTKAANGKGVFYTVKIFQ